VRVDCAGCAEEVEITEELYQKILRQYVEFFCPACRREAIKIDE